MVLSRGDARQATHLDSPRLSSCCLVSEMVYGIKEMERTSHAWHCRSDLYYQRVSEREAEQVSPSVREAPSVASYAH